MSEHISNAQLEAVMNRFNKENPNADSSDLARYMFNLGFEAGEQGGLDEINFQEEETYYQPENVSCIGLTIGGLPEGLSSFHVFSTIDACKKWLENQGYYPQDFAFIEYHGEDIEEHAYIS